MRGSMKLYTRKEAADALRIGLRTLDRWLAEGRIQCYRLGTGSKAPVRISEEQLAEYLANSQNEKNPAIHSRAQEIIER